MIYVYLSKFQQSRKTKSAAEELELTVLKVSHSLDELRKEVRRLARPHAVGYM